MANPRFLRRVLGSVRVRITLLAGGLFAATMVAASFGLMSALEHRLVADIRRDDAAKLQQQLSTQPVSSPGDAGMSVQLPNGVLAYQIVPVNQRVQVIAGGAATQGEPATTSQPDPAGERLSQQPIVALVGGDTRDAEALFREHPELFGGTPTGDYLVTTLLTGNGTSLSTASSLATMRRTLSTTRSILWALLPALVAIVAAMSWSLAARAMRPIQHIITSATLITSQSLDRRVPVPSSHDEVAELANTMNTMLSRIESAAVTSRRLVSDASHELRTPITVMRAELEVAAIEGDPDWPSVNRRVLGEIDRLQHLIDDLLLLARLDERPQTTESCSLLDVARDAAARRRRVPVVLDDDAADQSVTVDRASIERALDHVIANAARHARTVVQVHLVAQHDRIQIHVDDDGDGIPEAERERVLQRFVRLDQGRSRDRGGSGLGLAVAHEVVHTSGGSLEISTSAIGGTRVSFTWPAHSRR